MGLTHADVGLAMQGMDSLQRAILQRQMMDRQKKEDADKAALNAQLMGLRQTEAGNQNERYKQASKHEDRMYQAELDRNAVSQSRADAMAKTELEKSREVSRRLAVSSFEAIRKEAGALLKDGHIDAAAANRIVRSPYSNMNPTVKDGLVGTAYENDPGDIFKDQKSADDMVDVESVKEGPNGEKITTKQKVKKADYREPAVPPAADSAEGMWAQAKKDMLSNTISGKSNDDLFAKLKKLAPMMPAGEIIFNPKTGEKIETGPTNLSNQPNPSATKTPAPLPSQSESLDLGNGNTYNTTAVPSWKSLPEAVGIQAQIKSLDDDLKGFGSQAKQVIPEALGNESFTTPMSVPTTLQSQVANDAKVKAAIAKRVQLQKQLDALKVQYPGQQVPTVPATTPYPFE